MKLKTTDQLWFRFAIWVSGFVLAIWLAFAVLTFFLFKARLDEALDNSLSLSASQALAAVNIEDGALDFTDSIPDLGGLGTVLEGEFLVQIADASGQTIRSSGGMDVHNEALAAWSTRPERFYFSSPADTDAGSRFRAISVPVLVDAKVVGTLRIFRGLSTEYRALQGLLATLLAVLPLVVILGFAGSTLIARRNLLPLKRMVEETALISDGSLGKRLTLPDRRDEIGRLAGGFNELLDRLERAFEKEKRFTADASHELRTPLTALLAIIDATLARDRGAEAYQRALRDAKIQVARLAGLTDDLLQLAKHGVSGPPQADASLTWTTFDLAILVDDVVASLEALAERKALRIDCGIRGPVLVTGDRDALARAFLNIIGNAIKFTEAGSVAISLGPRSAGEVAVVIADTGIGIEARRLPLIFDRFYRASDSRGGEGAGLGLSLAHEIVSHQDGRIEVESVFGRGSTFTVVLPRA